MIVVMHSVEGGIALPVGDAECIHDAGRLALEAPVRCQESFVQTEDASARESRIYASRSRVCGRDALPDQLARAILRGPHRVLLVVGNLFAPHPGEKVLADAVGEHQGNPGCRGDFGAPLDRGCVGSLETSELLVPLPVPVQPPRPEAPQDVQARVQVDTRGGRVAPRDHLLHEARLHGLPRVVQERGADGGVAEVSRRDLVVLLKPHDGATLGVRVGDFLAAAGRNDRAEGEPLVAHGGIAEEVNYGRGRLLRQNVPKRLVKVGVAVCNNDGMPLELGTGDSGLLAPNVGV
mmetsp:Transcript_50855/g.132280  ORF Transcript_50855/g.132280 Transcript_50855/m.132280 type:complete len:292 (-) Transcript_50855:143-1018(-)